MRQCQEYLFYFCSHFSMHRSWDCLLVGCLMSQQHGSVSQGRKRESGEDDGKVERG